jgi:hypothetical protein
MYMDYMNGELCGCGQFWGTIPGIEKSHQKSKPVHFDPYIIYYPIYFKFNS